MGQQRRRFDALEAFVEPRGKLVQRPLRYRSWWFVRNAIRTSCLVVIVYFFSISLLFYNQKCFHRYSLVIVVVFIALGLTLFTFDLTKFSMEGFMLVLISSFVSGLRWSLAQIVMQKNEIGLDHPLDMMYHIQPWMMLALFPLSMYFEGVHFVTSKHTFGYTDINVMLKTVGIFLVGGMLSFILEISEFLLLSHTSGLTLTIAGVFRKLCVLLLAVLVKGDKINAINALGLVICLIGTSLHVVLNAAHANEQIRQNEPKPIDAETEMLLRDDAGILEDSEEIEEEIERDIFNVIDR
ncbi:Solute carrier family 35 member C2 [Lamellibrachia satsuma]|nr:Solute carrier family 35 member C2 [Lamellibrachia satsuma]